MARGHIWRGSNPRRADTVTDTGKSPIRLTGDRQTDRIPWETQPQHFSLSLGSATCVSVHVHRVLGPPSCHGQPQAPGHMVPMSQSQRTCSLSRKTQPLGEPRDHIDTNSFHQQQKALFFQLGSVWEQYPALDPPIPRWFIYEMTHRLLMLPTRISWKQRCHL